MDITTIALMMSWCLGGFVSGLTGIGGAMVALPITAQFIPMHDAIAVSCLMNLIMDGGLACMNFRHCRIRSVTIMTLGTIPGALIGLWIFQICPGYVLQVIAGAMLIFYVFWQRKSQSYELGCRENRVGGFAAGFGAGLFGTSISFDGPPVGAYALYCGWSPREVLGTLGVFFVIRSIISCSMQVFADIYTDDVIHYFIYAMPVCLLGEICALPIVKHLPIEIFRKCLIAIVAISGIVCLYQGFSLGYTLMTH